MSDSTRSYSRPKSRHLAPTDRPAFPVWAPLLVMVAVIITGVVLAWNTSAIPQTFFTLFAVASVVCTLAVEARGLFLTVVCLPLYFVAGTVFIGWLFVAQSPGGMRTRLLTAAYPTVEHFLWLAVPFGLCVLIALVRWRLVILQVRKRYRRHSTRGHQNARTLSTNTHSHTTISSTDGESDASTHNADNHRAALDSATGGSHWLDSDKRTDTSAHDQPSSTQPPALSKEQEEFEKNF